MKTVNTSIPIKSTKQWFLRFRKALALGCACALFGLSGTSHGQSLDLLEGFEGNVTGWVPADPIIAAGPSSLVTMVSGGIAIFNKQGTKLFEQNLGAGGFWAAQGADQVAEPWVIFDPNSGRFIATAADFGSKKGFLYLAVSKTSNPLSSADWHNLEKAPLLSGGSLNFVYNEPVITESYSEWLAFTIHPAVVVGPAPAMYFVQSLTRRPDDKIVVHALSGGIRTVSLVPVTPFDRPPNVPQLGSSILLENIDARLMSAVVRNGALWTSHAVADPADGESVVRWYQFDITGMPATDATLLQTGDVDPGPGIHTWLPHINADTAGNMGLCFSVGGASQYAAIGYTGRLATDPAGTTLPVHTARAGNGTYTQGGWGEYSGLAIDPDGETFWLFHQYPTGQRKQNWRTFVGAFQLTPPPPPADPLHSGDLDGSSANSGKNWRATVAVTIHDGNDDLVPGAAVTIQWAGGVTGTATLTSDSNGRCTFTSGSISKLSPSASLSILNVTHPALTYNASANHDPDLDSNGTTITVNKP